jgi:hypothetical protein
MLNIISHIYSHIDRGTSKRYKSQLKKIPVINAGNKLRNNNKKYVLPHMQIVDLGKFSNVIGLGSHDKVRAHMGGMGIGPYCRGTNIEPLK